MSGIDEVLEDFDMFVTPIHDGPSIGSGLTQGAPRRSSGSWARPSDAEFSQGRQIARCLLARGASSLVPHASQGTPPQSRTSHFMHILCMLARDEPEALRYRAMPGGGSPAERLCAPRVRGGSKPNPAPRNLGLDLILDNPTTNAPPPIHPVPPTFLHPDPSLLGVRNTEHRRMHSRPVTRIDRAHMDGTPPPTTCTNRMPLSKARTLPFAMNPETTCEALHRTGSN